MRKNCAERNVPLRLLAFTVFGAAVSLAADHFVRDPTLASGGLRVLGFPQMAIPFSGSYLVGFVFGLAAITAKRAMLRAASREQKNSTTSALAGVASRWPRAWRIVLAILIIGIVLFSEYVLVGISTICAVLGVVSASVV